MAKPSLTAAQCIRPVTLQMLRVRLGTIIRRNEALKNQQLMLSLEGHKYPVGSDNLKISNDGVIELELYQPNAAVAAIAYALANPCESPLEFLRCWSSGDFQALRQEWDDVPEEVFIDADPLHKVMEDRS
ncbi:hypothetical protein ACIOWK_20025 [Pseudomonas protegens]|uniref:hypothetical protein n=1 Tax=Pseudomonas protegens TaxID=380021 RepID=UPI00380B5331